MEVARRIDAVHLVSVDSMQVYRGMDIGTAKPTAAERAEVPHHCLDLVDPTDEFAVVDFREAYTAALASIERAAGRALLVGGTGLYHRLTIDEFDLPGQWPETLARLEAQPDTTSLHDELVRLDPAAAAKTEPGNRRRILRALEVTIGSGRPFSSYGPGLDSYADSPVVQIGLARPRSELSDRIAARVHQMIDIGLVEEVEGLRAAGFSRTARQALGYKEILQHLDGEIGKDEAIELIITRTRQFAVRQERWFRRDPRIRWFDVGNDADTALSTVLAALGS